MKRILISAAAVLVLSGAAFSAVDPSARTPSVVVGNCQLVADTRTDNPNANEGKCIGSTQDFVNGLKAAVLSPTDSDQQLIDLVTKLVPLVADDTKCDAFDDEVARAIKLASDNVTAADKKAQLVEISKTVAACQGGQTGALPRRASPTA